MPDLSTLGVFAIASLVLLILPGPAVLYIVSRSLHQGKSAGFASVLGISVGSMIHTSAAALGISALLVASATAFSLIKLLGAVYLIYLGIQTLLSREAAATENDVAPTHLLSVFRQGILVEALNPKAAIFFLAFLPQFADPARGPMWSQLLLLGLVFTAIALLSDSLYAFTAGHLGGWLKHNRTFLRLKRYFSGGTYIALGLATATAGDGQHSGINGNS